VTSESGAWLTGHAVPNTSRAARLGQDLDVPLCSMYANPLSILDELGGLLHPHDGAVFPGLSRVGHFTGRLVREEHLAVLVAPEPRR
jgi:hypothetical protein